MPQPKFTKDDVKVLRICSGDLRGTGGDPSPWTFEEFDELIRSITRRIQLMVDQEG